jgi:hypothetical protein
MKMADFPEELALYFFFHHLERLHLLNHPW